MTTACFNNSRTIIDSKSHVTPARRINRKSQPREIKRKKRQSERKGGLTNWLNKFRRGDDGIPGLGPRAGVIFLRPLSGDRNKESLLTL
ncbi:hypothetical protein Lal_00001844 [Lupinus albus]|nr:hypothetical protein Lal_00001844 [Lupinus albus]